MFVPERFSAATRLTQARTVAVRVAVEGGITLASWSTGMSKENLVQTLIWCRQWWALFRKGC